MGSGKLPKKDSECLTVNFLLGSYNNTLQLGYCFVQGFYMLEQLQKYELKKYHNRMYRVCATFTLKQELYSSL